MILWKEWRENLWKLWFCGGAGLAFTAMFFRMRIVPDYVNCIVISFAQMFIVPVVYALDIFSGEMSNRTIHLLFKIPVPRWMLFFSKYVVSAFGIIVIFLATSGLMERMTQGREVPAWIFLETNLLCGIAGLLLFTWFCAFGCQSRSEAGSLAVMFAVFAGWAIVFLWSSVCGVTWAERFVPYSLVSMRIGRIGPLAVAFSQTLAFAGALVIACYRYVSIRRYL
jgi:ABC-type transport system involved in multi-copper enzyme maturation permease subunit